MKIVFSGNCQAQTLSQMAHYLGLEVEIITPPPVFDVPAFSSKAVRDEILSADFIFAQRVSEDYVVDYIRPSSLREIAPDRNLIWPNIYFDGYFPGVRYMYAGTGEKVTGPLSDYHFDQIEKSWRSGATIDEAWQAFMSDELPSETSSSPAESSIAMLRERESSCDITMSDFIEENFAVEKLFYSMNHPSNHLLFEALSRMLRHSKTGLSLEGLSVKNLEGFPYTLNEIDLPILPAVAKKYKIKSPDFSRIHGRRLTLSEGSWKADDQATEYSGSEMIEAFYKVYDTLAGKNVHLTQGYD